MYIDLANDSRDGVSPQQLYTTQWQPTTEQSAQDKMASRGSAVNCNTATREFEFEFWGASYGTGSASGCHDLGMIFSSAHRDQLARPPES